MAVLTVDDIGGGAPEEMAGYLYEEYHYGIGPLRSGLLLLISMEERDSAPMTAVLAGMGAVLHVYFPSEPQKRSYLRIWRGRAAQGFYVG